MSVFIIRRLLTLLATLAGASLIIFLVLDALPGNAAEMLMGADSSPEAVRALTVKLGLDQPLALRYLHWVGGLLIGDLGNQMEFRIKKSASGNPYAIQTDGQPTASWGIVTNLARKAPNGTNLNDAPGPGAIP